MTLLPYTLTSTSVDSPDYYENVRRFADRMLALARRELSGTVDAFEGFIRATGREEPRGTEEYIFELLGVGTFWNLYANKAAAVSSAVTGIMSKLVVMRTRYPRYKREIDALRGFVSTSFLAADKEKTRRQISWSVHNLEKLIAWMRASGEYVQEAQRMEGWSAFLRAMDPRRAERILRAASGAALRFETAATSALGSYTEDLVAYQKEHRAAHRFRENYLMFAKTRTEYHLSMFGAEVLNRSFRQKFLETERRIVLLPGCMRGNNENRCRARRDGLDITCVSCTANCHIGRLSEQGRREGFEVNIIPHSSNFSKWLERWHGRKDVGVVGVTCVPNVLRGGYEMKKLDIPAQCVLLDFAGCKKHWLPRGIPTGLSRCELRHRLGPDLLGGTADNRAG